MDELAKRTLDLMVGGALLVPSLLLCLAVAPVIWAETRANPLFVQTRVGRNGRPYKIWKLRTMAAGTLNAASHEVGGATITRSGRVLRALKFDELPQIWNVLTGDMSFVGPRPCLPSQQEVIQARERLGVLALRPGITGPAQVAGLDMSEPERLAEADSAYCGKWSLRRDFSILAQTFIGKGSGDAAARG